MGPLDLLVPPLCAICAGPARSGESLCRGCAGRLAGCRPVAFRVPGIDRCLALGDHDGVAGELVHALKFRRRLSLARVAAALIAGAAWPVEGAIAPVPPSSLRHRWRGFDPAAEVATELARLTQAPAMALLRRHDRGRQLGRRRSRRIADPPRVSPRRPPPPAVTLVDDVVTTGATLRACATALREAGCTGLLALAIARA